MPDSQNEIRALLQKLQDEKSKILEQAAPLREKYESLSKEIQALEADALIVAREIKALEQPRIGQLAVQIAGLATALGGKRLSEGG